MNHRDVCRLRLPLLVAFAGATMALFVALDVSAAVSPPTITQRSTGKTFRIAKDGSAKLRLSNRWRWSTPRASTRAVDLVPVEYFVDPGFREWLIKARARGSATIRSLGWPNCTGCDLATRHFKVTIVVVGA
jgi:hypothetical protein